MTPGVFAAVAVTLFAAHQVADHTIGQTDTQAAGKARPGRAGWVANAAHVAQYHLVVVAMLAGAVAALNLPITVPAAAAGLGFSAVTHMLLDRRWPVRWLLEHTGSAEFARMGHPHGTPTGMNGMYLADQALHYGCLWAAALLMVAVS